MKVWIVVSWERFGCSSIEKAFAQKRSALLYAMRLRYQYAAEELERSRVGFIRADPHAWVRQVAVLPYDLEE